MNILLLAAEPRPLAELGSWLQQSGHEYRSTEPQTVDPWRPDVIVLWLPRLLDPAVQRCRTLRERDYTERASILAIGPWHNLTEIDSLIAAGADDYLSWPTDEAALALRLLVLERSRSRRPVAEHERRLQARIAQTQRAESMGALAGTLAHDFNNLLTAILGNVELALLDAPPESNLHHGLVQIENASQRAAELTRQMLRYAGKTLRERVPLNLTQLVEEMSELLRISVSRHCRIAYSFDRDLPAIQGDPAQLRQVVMNLLINASEAMGGKAGLIRVKISQAEISPGESPGADRATPLTPGDYISLQVSDEGSGMDEATQARIFDPFFTTRQSGRGLGLAAVNEIIQAHGGAIRVASQTGKGSTFEVLFPAAEFVETDAGKHPGSLEAWHGSGTVLLVDDEDAVREAARRLLERAGYTVLAACSGEQGLEIFQDFADEIRAIILDLSLPGLDGIEVFRAIHTQKPGLQVVAWSGFEQLDIRSRLAEIGPCVFIEKPSLVRELGAVLKNALQPMLEESGPAIRPGS